MRFASLGSGSKGNATLIQAGETLVMIDCGFSLRETVRRLQCLNVEPSDLDAILVTHEHSDHSSGVARLSRKYQIPVYMTHGSNSTGRFEGSHEFCLFNCEDQFSVGCLNIAAVAVPHDAVEPCQYRLSWEGRQLGLLTDLGSVTPHVVASFRDCQALILEFNHDLDMLMRGDYPPRLKQRVGSDWGHLNNEQAVSFLAQIGPQELQHLVVAHISEKNNSRARAEQALLSVVDSLDNVVWACQMEGFGWLEVAA